MEEIVDLAGKFAGAESASLDVKQIALDTARICMDLLLTGETGTGKDTLAKNIHELSGRCGAFIGMNCAAIPESLAESQLFGVVNGAYTGVSKSRQGYLEAAHNGTLYLDEIDSMPLTLQAKLLRILETRGVERLGSTTFIPLDLRVIASAQRPLDALVEQGLFRRDLYFRLNALTIHLPGLRQRREQILPLFDTFTRTMADDFQHSVPVLNPALVQVLLSHSWPGNIRELQSAAKRFVLGFPLLGGATDEISDAAPDLKKQLKVVERILILDAFKRHHHRVEAVARELELPKRTLYFRMKELGLSLPGAALPTTMQ